MAGVAAALFGLAVAGCVGVFLSRMSRHLWEDASVRAGYLWKGYVFALSAIVSAVTLLEESTAWLEWIGYGFALLGTYYVLVDTYVVMRHGHEGSDRE